MRFNWVVFWTCRDERDTEKGVDRWEIEETEAEARARYETLIIRADVFSAGIAPIYKATDWNQIGD